MLEFPVSLTFAFELFIGTLVRTRTKVKVALLIFMRRMDRFATYVSQIFVKLA
jgi:hypothetical protein